MILVPSCIGYNMRMCSSFKKSKFYIIQSFWFRQIIMISLWWIIIPVGVCYLAMFCPSTFFLYRDYLSDDSIFFCFILFFGTHMDTWAYLKRTPLSSYFCKTSAVLTICRSHLHFRIFWCQGVKYPISNYRNLYFSLYFEKKAYSSYYPVCLKSHPTGILT